MAGKYFMTGRPGCGKTTLLKKAVEKVRLKHGFLTEEVVDGGKRRGFKIIDSYGRSALMASKETGGDVRVGSFKVFKEVLDEFSEGLKEIPKGALLYIDEVGPMEIKSEKFQNLILDFLESENLFIGTIHQKSDDLFIRIIKEMEGIEMIEITNENRDQITTAIKAMFDEK